MPQEGDAPELRVVDTPPLNLPRPRFVPSGSGEAASASGATAALMGEARGTSASAESISQNAVSGSLAGGSQADGAATPSNAGSGDSTDGANPSRSTLTPPAQNPEPQATTSHLPSTARSAEAERVRQARLRRLSGSHEARDTAEEQP